MDSGGTRTKRHVYYYEEDSIVQFEEDQTHEFKGHRNVTDDELPPWAYIAGTDKRSRKAIDRAILAFLNTGQGGCIYCGILDDGRVRGLQLTQYNKDHFVAAVDDVMSRYRPAVHRSLYKVRFVPVIEKGCDKDEIERILRYDSTASVDPETRRRSHLIRSQTYCWCDKDRVALFNNGVIPPKYVIELVLKPWRKSDAAKMEEPSTSRLVDLHPIYEDEDGLCYMRRNASNIPLDYEQIYNMAKQDAMHYYEEEIGKLKEQILKMQTA